MEKINIEKKLSKFSQHWDPHIIAELNGQHVKLAKLKGKFVWHKHDNEDELFYILKGSLNIEFRDKTAELVEGEMIVIPRGVEHMPIAEEECSVMLFEPAGTINTGDAESDKRKDELKSL